jgi:ABC-type transport system substrate-binding protein
MIAKRPFYKITILFVLLVMFLSACSTATETTPSTAETQPTAVPPTKAPEYIDTFTFATSQEPTLLDPAIVYDGSDRITRLILILTITSQSMN